MNSLAVDSFDDFLSLVIFVGGRMFSKNLKPDGQILADNVSAVTQVLESFDPDRTSPLDGAEEDANPPVPGKFEEIERQADDGGGEDDAQLDEPEDVFAGGEHFALGSALGEQLAVVIVDVNAIELAVSQVVEQGCAGHRHQRVFDQFGVPQDFSTVGGHDGEGLGDPES